MTKPITSAGLMILVQQGLVKLDDNISDHINDLPTFEILKRLIWKQEHFQRKLQRTRLLLDIFLPTPPGWYIILTALN